MTRVSSAVAALFLAATSLAAQGALAALGQTDAAMREYALGLFADQIMTNSDLGDRSAVLAARKALLKLAPPARAQAMTGLYAWMKGYVASPAFKTDYNKLREERKPAAAESRGTVDEELKKWLASEKADAQQRAKDMTAVLGKAQADEILKSTLDLLNDPEMIKAKRMEFEEKRAQDTKDGSLLQKEWEQFYPPDPMTVVGRHLREFINTTADVDFAAKQEVVAGEGGSGLAFVNPAYNTKPWQWRFAYEFGPEAIGAARAAAQAWLKELGK